MSTTHDSTAETPDEERTNYQYVVVGTGTAPAYDTRHEAVGACARYDADRVVAVAESCCGRLHRNPEHLGNKYFADRRRIPTTHGVASIDRVDVVRMVNGTQQDTLESHWEIQCPVCYRTHETDDGSEAAREDALEMVHECCGAAWFPPSDWVSDCGICGGDHRGEFNCDPPARRNPFPGVGRAYRCVPCGWGGPGTDLEGPDGKCPECGSPAVEPVGESE